MSCHPEERRILYSNQQDPSQYNSWSKYHASRAQVPSRTEGALCLRSKVCSLRQFCYLSPRAPATRCQEHLNHNNGRGSLPLILCLCQYRTSPNHEGPILTSEGKGPCACAAKYDPFRKFIQNTGKRNGTSHVPYDTIALSDWDFGTRPYGID